MASAASRVLTLTYVGNTTRLTKANQEAETGLSKLGKSFKSFGKVAAAGVAAAAVAATAFAVKFGKDAVGAASDLDESINAVAVTFGEAAKGINQLADASATAVGLSKNEFNAFAVQFAGFTNQIASSDRDIVGVTEDLTTRIADFASVMNLDISRAGQVFQSTLAGSSEVARAYGIDVGAAAVEQFALENGLVNNKNEMDESIKVQARYGLIMQETEKFAGDFANTSDGLANSQRILKARFTDIQAEIGRRLVPIITELANLILDKVLPFIERWGSIIADKVGPSLQRLSTIIRDDIAPRIVILVGRVRDFVDVIREWWQRVSPGVNEAFRTLREPIRNLFDAFRDTWNATRDLFASLGEVFGAFRTGEREGSGFERFIRILVGSLNLVIAAMTFWQRIIQQVLDALQRLVESRWFSATIEGLGRIIELWNRARGLSDSPVPPPVTEVPQPGPASSPGPVPRGDTGTTTNITVNGVVGDTSAVAREIQRALTQEAARAGDAASARNLLRGL